MPKGFKFTSRCDHIHVSGRQCAGRAGADAYGDPQLFCPTHKKSQSCMDCLRMMEQFKPSRGWTHG